MARGKGTRLCSFGKLGTAIVLLIAFGTSVVLAQTSTATIVGVVRDTTGALVPGVTINIKHLDSGQTRTVLTNETGSYAAPSLAVGPYELDTVMPGFKQEVRKGINLVVGQQAVIDLTIEVGANAEQVTVSEEAPLVNTTLSSTSGIINEQQVKDLPLNGRSFDQLLSLNVGVVNNTSNMNAGYNPAFSVAGHRQETNRFLINGVEWVGGNATGQFITPNGASGQLLGVEAVREYNVVEHTYGAEYGKRAGGQVSVVTSSGTNNWHGDVFEYLRNSAVDARNFFEDKKGPFKRNQFGGAIGGPLQKDKLFIFGNYEGFRQRLARSDRQIVLDDQARQGFLPCSVIGAAANPCPPSGYALVPNLKPGILPYAQNFWPKPNGAEIFSNGLPTGTAYNYNNGVQSTREEFGLTRLDYVISPKDSLYGNYTISEGQRDLPQPNAVFIQTVPVRSQSFSLQETRVFSSAVVNSATLGWARNWSTQVQNPVTQIPDNLVFLPGGNPGSITIGGGATTVAAASIVPANGINPVRGIREYYTLTDDLHFSKGKHSFSAGAWIQRIHQNLLGSAQNSAGGASFTTLVTFLQDNLSQFNLNRNPIGLGYRTTEGAWYFQDEMKLRSNFTLRLGLRHEMTDGWNEVAGRCSNYVYDKNFVMSTEPVINHSCLTENHAKLLLQPRVGIAWDPTGTGTWAVRAGFGIHNDLQDNLGNRTYANPPYNAREVFTGSMLSLLPLQKNASLPPTCGTPGAPPSPACSTYAPGGVDPVLFSPTHQLWSLTVERGIAKDLMLSVGYVGSQSYHAPLSININTPLSLVCQEAQGCVSGGTTTGGAVVAPANRGLVPQGTLYIPPTTRPNPNVGNSVTWMDQGTSNYNALNVSFVKRPTHGFGFKTNYTWGKVIDMNSAVLAPSAGNEPPDIYSPYNRRLNRGVASYSLAHQLNGNFSYQLPFGSGSSGVVNRLIGGWQWNGIVSWQGGFPFTPLAGSNISGTGDANQSDTPSWNPNFHGPVILGRPNQWFDPRAFVLPTQGTFGNVGRGSLRGPGLFSLDTSFFKKLKISEGLNLQFRAEAFNVLNHPNFAYPNEVIFQGTNYSSSAGVITNTSTTSRQIQFALKLMY